VINENFLQHPILDLMRNTVNIIKETLHQPASKPASQRATSRPWKRQCPQHRHGSEVRRHEHGEIPNGHHHRAVIFKFVASFRHFVKTILKKNDSVANFLFLNIRKIATKPKKIPTKRTRIFYFHILSIAKFG
jgi:hypothetical protein